MLKIIVYIVFFITIITIATGYYLKPDSPQDGERIIGIGVLIFAFILMPLFIYLRYKGRDLSHFTFNQPKKEEEKK
jgi:amino acid transporter